MKIPKQARHEAKVLFRACFEDHQLGPDRVRRVVRVLLQDKPRGYLAILDQFKRLVKLELQRRHVIIESARPLPPNMQADVRTRLERVYGTGLTFTFSEEPRLLGGVRIQVGSDVYDGSIQYRLATLASAF